MTTAKNEDFLVYNENCYLTGGSTFGGGNKSLGLLGGIFCRWGEVIKFLKHVVQKHTQVS